jgi:hypothetical protein
MTIKLHKCLLALAIALSLCSMSSTASAGCRWVNGYWSHGYHHAGHRVCWGNRHHQRCGWRNGHRVCW